MLISISIFLFSGSARVGLHDSQRCIILIHLISCIGAALLTETSALPLRQHSL